MAEGPLERSQSDQEAPRALIVDLVFEERDAAPGRRLLGAVGISVAVYGLVGVALVTTGSGRGSSRARIHERLRHEGAIEVVPPPPPPPVAAVQAPPQKQVPVRVVSRPVRRAPVAAPAQAAAVLRRTAPEAPVDLTADTFPTAGAASSPGGATAGAGRSTAPVGGAVDVNAPPARRPTMAGPPRARAVTLDQGTWSCPWPSEADAEQIDEQTVVVRVRVREDGSVERAEVIADPGHGFGRAATACARDTQFQPARSEDGSPIAAWSPPIRVHFTR